MVTIKVGDDLLFSSTLQHLKYVVQDICLRKELNTADTLEMVIPDINVRKNLLTKGTAEITMWVNDIRRFRGRLVTKGIDFDKSIRVYCEGELAYLRDIMVRPYESSGETAAAYFEDMLDEYNDLIDAADALTTGATPNAHKKFVKGNVSTSLVSGIATRGNENYPTYLDELMEWLVNQYGGYIIPRYENGFNYLDYVTDEGNGSQVIRYGRNLLDYKNDTDYAPLFTRLIAIGSKPQDSGGGGDVPTVGEESVTPSASSADTEPPKYTATASSTVLARYGMIEALKQYDDITNYSALVTRAEADLAKGQTMTPSLEISAVDMVNIDHSEPFDIGKKYRLISPAHGYTEESDRVLLVRMEEYPLQMDRSVYTFGAVNQGISQVSVQTNRSMNAVAQLAVDTSAKTQEMLQQLQELDGDLTDVAAKVNAISDYVTAETDSGDWTLRTWHSGRKELWATTAASSLTFVDGVATKTFNLPSGSPTTAKAILITGDKSANYYGTISNGTLTVTITKVADFMSATLSIYIKGE